MSLVVRCRRRNLLCRQLSSLLWNLVVMCLVALCRRRNLLCRVCFGIFESCRTLSEKESALSSVVESALESCSYVSRRTLSEKESALSSLLWNLCTLLEKDLLCRVCFGIFESCRTLLEKESALSSFAFVSCRVCFGIFESCRTLLEKESAFDECWSYECWSYECWSFCVLWGIF